MKPEEILQLINAGYTKAEIDAMTAADPEPAGNPDPAGDPDPEPAGDPDPACDPEPAGDPALTETVKSLSETVKALTATVKAMQAKNAAGAESDPPVKKTVEDVAREMFGRPSEK